LQFWVKTHATRNKLQYFSLLWWLWSK
jgi:hypothetical protein